jgi:hypothetical protein
MHWRKVKSIQGAKRYNYNCATKPAGRHAPNFAADSHRVHAGLGGPFRVRGLISRPSLPKSDAHLAHAPNGSRFRIHRMDTGGKTCLPTICQPPQPSVALFTQHRRYGQR